MAAASSPARKRLQMNSCSESSKPPLEAKLGTFRINLALYAECSATREISLKRIDRTELITNEDERFQLMAAIAETIFTSNIDPTNAVAGLIYTKEQATNFLPAAVILIASVDTFMLVSISGAVRVSTEPDSDKEARRDPVVAKLLVRVWGEEAYLSHAYKYWAVDQQNQFFRYVGCSTIDGPRYEICGMNDAVGLFEDRPFYGPCEEEVIRKLFV